MNPRYPIVAERAAHRCEYCRAPEAVFNFRFEIEHIVPQVVHGEDDEGNLALACRACNVHKSVFLTSLDPVTSGEVPLFNPRTDRWDDHFELDAQTGVITGITAIGRASAARLRMNSPLQLEARLTWIKLGLVP